jgi:hypothetical protein
MGICKSRAMPWSRAMPLEWGIPELRAPLKEFTDIKNWQNSFHFQNEKE